MLKKEPYQSFFSAVPLPALILQPGNPGFIILEANEAFTALTGKKKESLIGKEIRQAFPENPQQENSGYEVLLASLNKVITSGNAQKIENLRYDLTAGDEESFDEKYWTSENVPIRNAAGGVEYIIHVTRDVTEEVLLNQKDEKFHDEIIQLRDQHRHFISSNPDAMYSLDIQGNFMSANEGTCKLIGIPLQELLQMNFLPLCAPEDKDRIWGYFRKAIAGESINFEANFISGKGKRLVLSISLAPMVLNGNIAGAYGIAKDVTDLRASEKIIIEKRKFLEVNAAFISALLDKDLEHETLQKAFANIGKTIGVDRTYYFIRHKEPETGKYVYSQRNEWSSPSVESQLHNPALQNIKEELVEEVVEPLKANRPFFANQKEITSRPVKETFMEQDIKSMLLYPVFVENEFDGFVGFDDCTREREWTQDEITFLRTLAHNLTNALEKQRALLKAKQNEEHLDKSERKFRSLVQEGSDLIAIIDLSGNFQFLSDSTSSALGITPEKFLSKNAFDYVHPDDRARLMNEFSELLSKKQKKSQPFRFKSYGGDWRWIETAATNLLEDPAVGGIVLNSRDITTNIEQAREIEQINERYRLAAAATNDLIYDWDLENNHILRFYKGVKDLFGYTEKEIDDKNFWRSNVHPQEREREILKLKEALYDKNQNTIRTEYRFRRADGTYARVTDKGYILRDSEGKAIRIIGATSDISDITAKEEALRLANQRFSMAMKATNEIIWDWDVKNDFVTRSEAFEKIYGYKHEETNSVNSFWLGKVIEKDRRRVKESLFAALSNRKQKMWREEYCLEKGNGEKAHIIDRGYIVRDTKGNAIRVVGAILDVTESRRLIREIKQQNEGLKEIAWKQSHEVRAPLARLKGLVQLLKSQDFEDLNREEILDHILCSANELDQIVREIVAKTEKIEINHEKNEVLKAISSSPEEPNLDHG